MILDSLDVDTPKTRTILDMLSALDISGKALLVTAEKSDAVITSCANAQNVRPIEARNLSVLDTASVPNLLMTKDAVKEIESLWGNGEAS